MSNMRGWSEEELHDRRLMAPCGLYCGACGVYIAQRDGNEKFRNILARLYGSRPEETVCHGCMQQEEGACLYFFCRSCSLRECVLGRGLTSCHQCTDFPCPLIENFPIPVGKRVMKRAIPRWRELVARYGEEKGSVEWAKSECERYHCPDCGAPLFRGATRCRECKKEVTSVLDGENASWPARSDE